LHAVAEKMRAMFESSHVDLVAVAVVVELVQLVEHAGQVVLVQFVQVDEDI
jgi:hypothetical protein